MTPDEIYGQIPDIVPVTPPEGSGVRFMSVLRSRCPKCGGPASLKGFTVSIERDRTIGWKAYSRYVCPRCGEIDCRPSYSWPTGRPPRMTLKQRDEWDRREAKRRLRQCPPTDPTSPT